MNDFKQQEDDPKLTVKLLDKTYQIKCPADKVDDLSAAAERLDKEMRKMRQSGMVGMDRIAIITALNLARLVNELEKTLNKNTSTVSGRLQGIQRRIDDALTQVEQLEL